MSKRKRKKYEPCDCSLAILYARIVVWEDMQNFYKINGLPIPPKPQCPCREAAAREAQKTKKQT